MRILGLLLVAVPAFAGGTITRLSNGSAADQQNSPAISGTQVVWTDVVTGPPSNFDIYGYDINTGLSKNLTNTPGNQEFLEDIDGSNVVWTHTSSITAGDIVVYDLLLDRASTIASASGGVHYEQPSIRGHYVTFLKVSSSKNDVYLYDLANGPVGLVTNDAATQGRPRVAGDWVVFEDYSSGNSDILGWRISTGITSVIANGAGDQVAPDIDGSTVIFTTKVGGTDQIFAYDLTTGATRQLTSAASTKVFPRISGSRIVWSDDRNGNLDLYTYDLAASKEELLVGGPGDQFLSDIDGFRVVYTDNASGFEQVFLYTFDDPPPVSNLPEGCDPAKTDAVGAPVTLVRSTHRPVYAQGSFTASPSKTYWVCVDNGKSDDSQRASQFTFQLNGSVILNPSDFKPNNDPPRHVAEKLPINRNGHRGYMSGAEEWEASLFGCGNQDTTRVTVTIRVSK